MVFGVYPYFAHVAESVRALYIVALSAISFLANTPARRSAVRTQGIVSLTDDCNPFFSLRNTVKALLPSSISYRPVRMFSSYELCQIGRASCRERV